MSKTTEDNPRRKQRGQVQLRQGEIVELDVTIEPSDSPGRGKSSSGTEHLAIVVSHDCDIDADADRDPFVEFIPLRKVKKLDSSKTHAKSARILQFEGMSSDDSQMVFFEAQAPSKFSMRKTLLWDRAFPRPYSISHEQRLALIDWLSARYRRAALPNEFETRFNRVRVQFWNLIRDFNHELLAVLFLFDEGQEQRECNENEPYSMSILLVHPGTEPSVSFEDLVRSIGDLFERHYGPRAGLNHAGIEIRQCTAISEFVLPLALYRTAIQARADWLSHESDPPGPVVGV